jgi:hypothetical protein
MIGKRGKEVAIIEVEAEMKFGVMKIKFGEVEVKGISGDAEAVGSFSAIENVDLVAAQCVGDASPIEDAFVDVVIDQKVRVFAETCGNVDDRV